MGFSDNTRTDNMDSNDTFWIQVWRIVAAIIAVIALTIGGCTANTHRLISKDIAAGGDPIRIKCAHTLYGSDSAVCAITAAKP